MFPQVITTGPEAQQTADTIFDAVFERSLQFQIELAFEETRAFIRRINQYNDFHWSRVLDALDHVDQRIPRRQYGAGNPNNGQRDYTLRIGREGSPVLYLDRLEVGHKVPLTDAAVAAICQEMELIGKADEADASVEPLSFASGRKVTFRFWWD
jgi:hypothetical protein